jgi:hypothetical protein
MLSATANAAKSAQNCPKLPKFAKICPNTISLRNFKMPPKIEIFSVFQKLKFLCVEEALGHVFTVWIFNPRIFHILFLLSKNGLLYVNFSIPPCGN